MATAERPSTKQRHVNGISGIRLGNTLVTHNEMIDMSPGWKQFAVSPGLGVEDIELSDEEILRRLLHEVTPLDIKGESEDGTPVELVAQLERFSYSIIDKPHFQAFSLRLAPTSGRIESVSVDLGSSNNLDVVYFESNPRGIVYELGYGTTFRLELLFEPLAGDLPLLAPTSHQERIYT